MVNPELIITGILVLCCCFCCCISIIGIYFIEESDDDDDDEVAPSLSATHAFFNILSNCFQNESKEQRHTVILAETVANLRDAAERM